MAQALARRLRAAFAICLCRFDAHTAFDGSLRAASFAFFAYISIDIVSLQVLSALNFIDADEFPHPIWSIIYSLYGILAFIIILKIHNCLPKLGQCIEVTSWLGIVQTLPFYFIQSKIMTDFIDYATESSAASTSEIILGFALLLSVIAISLYFIFVICRTVSRLSGIAFWRISVLFILVLAIGLITENAIA